MNNFDIICTNNSIIIEKNAIEISIEKRVDGDIWFISNSNCVNLPISFFSRNRKEWRSYDIFANLMKAIIGRYILSGAYQEQEYNQLPIDFIDLEKKVITWHSDSEICNILKLHFTENEILVSIMRDSVAKSSDNYVRVRIRTSGSEYGNYYQEFERFFNDLLIFASKFKPKEEPETKEKSKTRKRII